MKLFLTPGAKTPRRPPTRSDTIPPPPSHIPWPVRRDDSDGGCFPKGGIPGKPDPRTPQRHPRKSPTPNRRGR